MKDVKALVREYFEEQKLMQLATVGEDSQPWVCSVWQAMDEQMNIYFISSVTRRHSKEIERNNNVAGALAKQHTPGGAAQGIQFEGSVEVLEDEGDIIHARSVFEGRIFDKETIDNFIEHPEKPHKFYKITPKKIVLFDTVNFPEDSRQEIEV